MRKVIDYIARFVFLACGLGVFAAVGAWETDHISFLRALQQVLACSGVLLVIVAVQAYIQQK